MATLLLINAPEASAEVLAVIGMAMQTNGSVSAMLVPVDAVFGA
ncbi:hypothetical protein [uncultured Tateyamaria sp.]|nr:hypothetical protein [uncultured Tateyamaria sp.]